MAAACFLNILRFAASMGCLAMLISSSRVSILLQIRWLVTTSLVLGLLVDLSITVSMCYYLQKLRNSESQRTRNMHHANNSVPDAHRPGVERLFHHSSKTILEFYACVVERPPPISYPRR
ncbi:hypothetical protein B0H16DRAFT_120733 [Mycena metata]|uniref:Uncharacterized protein n=1 Tax=Mycena metata TaxID=1033252 RepID=A0AAD7MWU0_9AGAR|nr:hypothetical protein B0H16DRAFT_120733 [Mycena metata]